MFRLDKPPVYASRDRQKPAPTTETITKQLQHLSCDSRAHVVTEAPHHAHRPHPPTENVARPPPKNRPPPTKSARSVAQSVLYLNRASDDTLREILTSVNGVGALSLNRIITQRFLHGHFASPHDFDLRISYLSFSRLQHLSRQHAITVSLRPPPPPPPSDTSTLQTPPLSISSTQTATRGAETHDHHDLVLATWNTAHLSPKSRAFSEKLHHLLTFVRDSDVHVLALQEMSRAAVQPLTTALRAQCAGDWRVYQDTHADLSLAMVYRADRVHVRTPTPYPQLSPSSTTKTGVRRFLRAPQLAVLTPLHGDTECAAFALANVHLAQTRPGPEVQALASLLADLQARHPDFVSAIGDFNLSADALAFDAFRALSLVEVVRPPHARAQPHGFRVVSGQTTAGGLWLDNLWVAMCARHRVRDAWCFDFARRRRALTQSAHAYAADRRSRWSDHLPLAISINLSSESSFVN